MILSGSAAWQMGIPGYGAYSATKAALVSFVRSWTAELAGRGIRANVISLAVPFPAHSMLRSSLSTGRARSSSTQPTHFMLLRKNWEAFSLLNSCRGHLREEHTS
ncbi:MAG: SDR family oxidoreductase [Terriglobia bacterium]